MKLLIFLLSLFLFLSCASKTDIKKSKPSINIVSNEGSNIIRKIDIDSLLILKRVEFSTIPKNLKIKKNIIDTLYSLNKSKLLVFVKQTNKDELVQINDENFPDSVETTFNILKDNYGKVVSVLESPFSESGDWDITLRHYFDEEGKTFAFERQTNFFNSECTEGVAYETRVEFFDKNFKLIAHTYKLFDSKNKPLQKDSCYFPYDYDFKIFINQQKCFNYKKIKL